MSYLNSIFLSLCVILLFSSIPIFNCINPGFQVAVTQKGIDYLLQIGLPIIKEKLDTLTNIGDNSGEESGITYNITNIVFSNIDFGTLTLSLNNEKLLLTSVGIALSGSANWEVNYYITFSGGLDISVDNTALSIGILVKMNETGHPELVINDCNLKIDKVKLKLHGDGSEFFNLFDKTLGHILTKLINSQGCKKLVTQIELLASKKLTTFPIEIPIPYTEAKINYALVSNPTFTPEYMLSQHKGEFEYIHNSKEAPFKPSPLPMPKILDKMIYIWLSPYTINTAAYVYERAGLLQIHANSSIVPPDSPFQITTELFSEIIPEFYHKYPDMKFTIRVYSTTSPYLKVSPNEIQLDVNGILEVGVIDGNNISSPAFNLTLSSKLSGDVSTIEKDGMPFITGELLNIENNVSIKDSAFGQFNTSRFTYAADLFLTYFLIPGVNKFLANGIQIPMIEGVHFIEPEIIFGDDYILISTDVEYQINTDHKRSKKWTL